MKMKHFLFSFSIAFSLATFPMTGEEIEKSPLEDVNIDQLSETLGHLIVRHLQNPGFQFNVERLIQGIQDEKEGKEAPMTEEAYEQAISAIQESLFLKSASENLAAAEVFLKKNLSETGIVMIDPKIQYKIETEGRGAVITTDCTPLIHYTGRLLNGTVFASSHENESPVSLPIKQTIPGFHQGLVGMKEGEKRTLFIHPDMAYGVAGHLPPNSLLIFEVEVLKADTAAVSEETPSTDTPA